MRRSDQYRAQGLPVPPEEMRRLSYGLTSLGYSPLALYSLLNSITPGIELPGAKAAGELYDKTDKGWRDIMDVPEPESLLSSDQALELLGGVLMPSQLTGIVGKIASKTPETIRPLAKAAAIPADLALTTSSSLKGKAADVGIGYGLGGLLETLSNALSDIEKPKNMLPVVW